MFGWVSLLVGDILGFFRDEGRVKELARLEMKRKQLANRQPTVENNKEMDDAIAAFLNRVTTRKPAAEPTVPPRPAEGESDKPASEPRPESPTS
jgi:hypothetical protein